MAGEHIHGRMIIDALCTKGMTPALVVNETGTDRADRMSRFLRNDFDNPPTLAEFDINTMTVHQFDGTDVLSELRRIAPDYIINGGAGFMHDEMIEIAVPLNAHPGILPMYRGLDPVLWSVFNGDPVGASLHVITKGLDQGPLLIVEQMPWRGAQTLLQARLQCMRWCAELTTRFLENPSAFPAVPQKESAANYYSNFPCENLDAATANLTAINCGGG